MAHTLSELMDEGGEPKTDFARAVIERAMINGITPAQAAKEIYGQRGNAMMMASSSDDVEKELAEIKAKAIADGTFMKAPNGKPTKLTERQWLHVRLREFKNWFGDWELKYKVVNIISAAKEHGFANFAEARKWAKENIVGSVTQTELGSISISGAAVEKYLSGKAVEKSDNNDVHLSALRMLPQIIKNSIVGEIHKDRDNNTNIKDVVRLFSAVSIDGKTYRVKTTVKRYNDANTKSKAYSYEVTEIELLEGESGTSHTQSADSAPTSNNSITAANLLKGVKNSKGELILDDHSKVVDENGEPLVVYHGSNFIDDATIKGDWSKNTLSYATYFSPRKYANFEHYYAAFLNIRNPLASEIDLTEEGVQDKEIFDRFIINKGYDGAISNEHPSLNAATAKEIIATSQNQIKSATDNNGRYSNSPDVHLMEGSDGIVYGWCEIERDAEGNVVARHIYLNDEDLNANTMVHELGHLWLNLLSGVNPELYEHGLSLVKQHPLFAELKESDEYGMLSDDEIADEVLARMIGDRFVRKQKNGTPSEFRFLLKVITNHVFNPKAGE